jgi:hypothetical protein
VILAGLVVGTLIAATAAAGEPAPPPEGRATRTGSQASFEGLFAQYQKAQNAGNTEAAATTFAEIRRLRVERNITSVDSVGLALVVRGLGHLDGG